MLNLSCRYSYQTNVYANKKPLMAQNPQISFAGETDIEKVKAEAAVKAENRMRKGEMALRKTATFFTSKFNKSTIDKLHDEINKVPMDSPMYPIALANLSKYWSLNQDFEVNSKGGSLAELNKALEDIASSDESCIFVMNHDNQSKDPKMMALFNAMLTKEYLKQGKIANYPKPKIVLNEDIILSAKPKMQDVYKWVGAVGIDASLNQTELTQKHNAKIMIPMLRDFMEDKANIFIYPEGRNCVKKNAELKERFQTGIGDIIRTSANKKKRVKIIPLGFAYEKGKNQEGKKELKKSIYIGEPIYITTDGNTVASSAANALSEQAKDGYKNYFSRKPGFEKDDTPYFVLKNQGVPVTQRSEQGSFIAGVVAENLRICVENAKTYLNREDSELVEI